MTRIILLVAHARTMTEPRPARNRRNAERLDTPFNHAKPPPMTDHPPRRPASLLALQLAALALPLMLACGSDETGSALPGASLPILADPQASAGPSTRASTRDGHLRAEIPIDLVVQPFASSLMATSPDGSFRLQLEPRPGGLLEVLGRLKDELIGLGWELESEKHFQSAIHLQLGQGLAKSRVTRAIWLVERSPPPANPPEPPAPSAQPGPRVPAVPAAIPAKPTASPKPPAVSVLCEAQAKGPGVFRLGAAHRGICQSIEVVGLAPPLSGPIVPNAPTGPTGPAAPAGPAAPDGAAIPPPR